ncbi:tape measure protein [Piscinibacter koreensis]|uniref:Tape measure protein n=1 Tax=Piscinibacter koreensis TaxID=2742824 RepID=A0A7Y6NTA4_9BURK|nr:tape measure protein [Schlegelella koreensis]NUZ08941.1 tape measure protein [Schlegelella koreensis]
MTVEGKIRITASVDDAVRNLRQLRGSFDNLNAGVARAVSAVQTFGGIVIGAEGVRRISQMADNYANMAARLKGATRDTLEFNAAQASSIRLAQQYQAPLAELSTLMTRVLGAVRPLGGGLKEAQVTTEAMLAALKLGGSTAAEAGSAITQFSQALGSGALRGEEFNAIAEAAPRLLDALAAGLGKPRDQLKKLAEDGALTTSAVVGALTKALPQLRAEAAQMPATIGGAAQAASDALSRFVGRSAEGSAAVKTLIGAFRLLAENIDTVVTALAALAAALLAVKIGGFVASLGTAVTAAGALAGGITTIGIAARGLLSIIGGPVGLIVTLGSLALAWIGVQKAQKAATERTVDTIRAERDAVQKQLDDLKTRDPATATFARASAETALASRLLALNREIEVKLREKAGPRGGPALGEDRPLRDPRTVTEFENDNKTLARIQQEYADKRAAYILAKDREIAAARLAGNLALERKLQQEKAGALAEQAKNEREAVAKATAPGAGVTTRVARYKEEYDRIAAIVADSTQRQLDANKAMYDEQLVSTRQFFATRGALEDEQSAQEIARIEAEIAARRRVVKENTERLKRARSGNDREGFEEAIAGDRTAIAQLEVDLVKAGRDRAAAARSRAVEERRITDELARQRAEVDYEIRAGNDQLTVADERLRLEREFTDMRRRERQETGGTAKTDELIQVRLRIAEIRKLQDAYGTLADAVRLKEEEIDAQVRAGAITTTEAERLKFEARAKSIPLLENILRKLQELAATDAEKNAVEGLRQNLAKLKDTTTDLERSLRGAALSNLTTALNDVSTGAKSTKAALVDMVRGFATAMLNVLNQGLAEQLVKQFQTAASSASGGGGFWGSLLGAVAGLFGGGGGSSGVYMDSVVGVLHTGGIAGGSGGWKQRVPAAAFALAPRYHSGGIAGLKPNEVPAVLELGEEVLKASDPRHVRNLGALAMGGVTVNVSVSGADGADDDRRAFGDELGRRVRATVIDVIANERRQGGMLAGAR